MAKLLRQNGVISIHAPRTGSDSLAIIASQVASNFNPRSPHGERLYVGSHSAAYSAFQSTLPARGATLSALPVRLARQSFQSTLPARGATS